MLVLTRKPQERVHVGNNITLTIVSVKGNAVRIGIDAPQDVRILRGEIAEREAAPVGEAVGETASGTTVSTLNTGSPEAEELLKAVPREQQAVFCDATATEHAVSS